MGSSCIFCKIVAGEIPSAKILETERAIVIRDIQPQAPVHLLVVPKVHYASLEDLFKNDAQGGAPFDAEKEAGALLSLGYQAALSQGLMPGGFRTVINTGVKGGQTVFHLHVHVLGGSQLGGGFA